MRPPCKMSLAGQEKADEGAEFKVVAEVPLTQRLG